MRKYLHILNNSNERCKSIIQINEQLINLSLKPNKWFTNLLLHSDSVFKVVKSNKNIRYILSSKKMYHPDQLKYNEKNNIQTKEYDEGIIYYSLTQKCINPKKILITFPGISNFDNINYRLSALSSVQNKLSKEVAILAFQDNAQVFGNYMYKTEKGYFYKFLVSKYIKDLLHKFQLTESDLIFYGNSKGGTICFDYINIFKDSYFFIDIPQVNLFNTENQNDLLRFSLGEEARIYHNHKEDLTSIASDRIVYSFAENDYQSSEDIPAKDIRGIEVNILKSMSHTGAAMRLVLRQLSKIVSMTCNSKPVLRPALTDRINIDKNKQLMFFKKKLRAFEREEQLKHLYVEICFNYTNRPDINISLDQYFSNGEVFVEWTNGFEYKKHLPDNEEYKLFLKVYYNFKEFVYPLKNTNITVD